MEALRESDDFMSRTMLRMRIPGMNPNQLSAALLSLREYHAVDVIIEPDGVGWWYALPPEEDQRRYHVEERTPETKPRSVRKGKRAK